MTNSMTNESKQKIEMGKEYTSNGEKMRLLCIDGFDKNFKVLAMTPTGVVCYFTEYGKHFDDGTKHYRDLVEYSPWQDVAVDTKVLCGAVKGCPNNKRHFAKYEDGKVYVFSDGRTSFTNESKLVSFQHNKLAE